MPPLAAAGLILLLLALPAAAHGQGYRVPPDNPYAATPGARGEIYLYGMRNPYRWSFDRLTGDLYVGDVGGINEEITYLPAATAAGANLGWSCFSGTASQSGCTPARYAAPAFQYPSSADVVIGGYVVRDPALPAFQGRYLFGRFSTGQISALGPGAAPPEVNTGVTVPTVSGFGEDGAGHLWATSLNGSIYRFGQSGAALTATAVGGFDQPVAVAAPPGDPARLFVAEKPGLVRLRSGSALSTFLDIRALVGDVGGEEGLLAIAVAPDYAASGRLFAYYTDNAGDLQLDEFRRAPGAPERADPASRVPVLTIPHGQADNHNGGQLLFGPDGRLYLSTGDGGTQGDPEGDAQSLASLLGKILRLDVGVSAAAVPPAGPPPATADRSPPRLRVRARKRQRVLRLRGAVAVARCDEACTVRATGMLRIAKRRYRLRPTHRAGAARPAQATRPLRLKVRLTRRTTRALRRALRRGRQPKVRIVLQARDGAGNRSPRARRSIQVLRLRARPAGARGTTVPPGSR